MYQDRVVLSQNDIYNKEFKIDTRGYRPQEVDKFLDIIINDYEVMTKRIKELEEENKSLLDDNMFSKQQIRELKTKLDVINENKGTSSSNVDMLRRISNLEKIIYGEK